MATLYTTDTACVSALRESSSRLPSRALITIANMVCKATHAAERLFPNEDSFFYYGLGSQLRELEFIWKTHIGKPPQAKAAPRELAVGAVHTSETRPPILVLGKQRGTSRAPRAALAKTRRSNLPWFFF